MKYNEALKCLQSGQLVKTEDGKIYTTRFDDMLCYWDTNDLKWKEFEWNKSSDCFNSLINSNFSLAADPEEFINPILDIDKIVINVEEFYSTIVFANKDINIPCDFFEAIKTLFILKSHPLVTSIKAGLTQFSIYYFTSGNGLDSWEVKYHCHKIGVLSPIFSSEGDVKKAISDIGEDRLIHMFKTLQGVK